PEASPASPKPASSLRLEDTLSESTRPRKPAESAESAEPAGTAASQSRQSAHDAASVRPPEERAAAVRADASARTMASHSGPGNGSASEEEGSAWEEERAGSDRSAGIVSRAAGITDPPFRHPS